jgi:hypothetical protein
MGLAAELETLWVLRTAELETLWVLRTTELETLWVLRTAELETLLVWQLTLCKYFLYCLQFDLLGKD